MDFSSIEYPPVNSLGFIHRDPLLLHVIILVGTGILASGDTTLEHTVDGSEIRRSPVDMVDITLLGGWPWDF